MQEMNINESWNITCHIGHQSLEEDVVQDKRARKEKKKKNKQERMGARIFISLELPNCQALERIHHKKNSLLKEKMIF